MMRSHEAASSNEPGLRLDLDTGIWQIDVTICGRRRQLSAKTTNRMEARKLRDKVRAELWSEVRLGERAGPAKRWEDAVALYLERAQRRRNRSIDSTKDHLSWLSPHLAGPLESITDERISQALDSKAREGVTRTVRGAVRRLRDVSPTTLNRYYSTIHAVLSVARERGWVRSVPRWDRAKEEARVEYLTRDQWARLRENLPEHLVPLAEFSIATGLRQSAVTHLEWAEVALERSALILPAEKLKNGKPLHVPLSGEAVAVLTRQKGSHERWVFPNPRTGEPFDNPASRAWGNALVAAGLPRNFRWHSLRSTFAVWHLEAGTPLEVVMRLGGWSRLDVLLRHYAHFSQGIAARYVNSMSIGLDGDSAHG